jgi:[protein-PII] uridylyltransferase
MPFQPQKGEAMHNISESLKKQREQILTDSSEEMLGRHTSLLEIALISLYNRLANQLDFDTEQFRASGAIIALEAFGRGLVGPRQTIPVLFLKADSSPWKESWLDEITAPLTEAGWKIEALQGTVGSLMERVNRDFGFLPRLLDSRYISGNRQLADQLDKALEAAIDARQNDLLNRLEGDVGSRSRLLDDPDAWLEPDLERNPGALPEIAAIRAGCRIVSNIRGLEDAIFQGYLTRQEVDFLLKAEKTYVRVLTLLRTISNDSTGCLRFDDQELLARKLGYSAMSGFLPVEAFMQEIYRLFHGVSCVAGEFWERLRESRLEGESGDGAGAETLEEGLLVKSRRIYIQTEHYPVTAGHLVHLFSTAAKHKLDFANVTRQWIRHNRNVLDTAAGDSKVKEELLNLIRWDDADLKVVRRFYNLRLASSLIPGLGSVHGLAQHDAFHIYPVHEHHLRTLSELKKLLAGQYAEAEPELTLIARGMDDPIWLLVSGFLHDIGKSSGRGHAAHGAEMVPTIARRLGLSADESDMVQFMVAQHLLLMDNASLRDLADEEMLAKCALIVRTPERLDLLAALSFADMAATGPKAIRKWRDTPAIALYERLRHLLEKGEPSPQAIAERIEHIRAQVAIEVEDISDSAELEDYFSRLPPRYLLSMSPAAIARHLRMQWELKRSGEDLIWQALESDGVAEITLISRHMPGLLWRAAGILTLRDMNIMEAQVFTMNDDVMLLIFKCRSLAKGKGGEDLGAVQTAMTKLLQGKMAIDYRIALHAEDGAHDSRPARQSPSQILIDNEGSQMYTILEVYTLDRVGLLYTISRALYELQIRIWIAKITTKIDQVADVFYIQTHRGEKVTDPEQIEEIKNALRYWLEGSGR